jgi:DNA invertase Pin-like site-specific DNA recombinase
MHSVPGATETQAEYVRMSTEHQQYSTQNQADKIREYAAGAASRSSAPMPTKARAGCASTVAPALQQLIKDVEAGNADFQIILVYDVSRWGRFQDADESAYYEYICRRAGIQVAYCAEQFENDGSPVSTIVKGVKRAMAGEYSRELSAKVFAGQCRLIEMGFRQGGPAGYGLRRVLIDQSGNVKANWRAASTRACKPTGSSWPGRSRSRHVNQIYRWFVDETCLNHRNRRTPQRPGRAHRPRARLDARHGARGTDQREIHRQQRLQPELLQAQEAPGGQPPRDVDQEGRRVRGIVPPELFYTAQGIMRARRTGTATRN